MQTLIIKVALHLCSVATPWVVARQVPLSMGFSKQEYWTGSPCSPPGPLLIQGLTPRLLSLQKRQADALPLEPPGSPHCTCSGADTSLSSVLFSFLLCVRVCVSYFFFNFYFINVTSFKMLGIQKLAQCSK